MVNKNRKRVVRLIGFSTQWK